VRHHERVRARSKDHYWGVVLDASDPPALGRFYVELLGWKIFKEEPNNVTLAPPDGVAYGYPGRARIRAASLARGRGQPADDDAS
jgi:hypothetical protein